MMDRSEPELGAELLERLLDRVGAAVVRRRGQVVPEWQSTARLSMESTITRNQQGSQAAVVDDEAEVVQEELLGRVLVVVQLLLHARQVHRLLQAHTTTDKA